MSRWSEINFKLIIKILGVLLIIEGLFMFTALPFSAYYGGGAFDSILLSGLIACFAGFVCWFATKNHTDKSVGKKEGYLVVTLSWVVISIMGAVPFYLSGEIPSVTDAFFETMSGFTTTGASILSDIESVPEGLLFWRSMTHWLGGMGIIVLSLAILPLLGIGGMQLFVAETPGPTKDKLHPRITETARTLWSLYVILTLAETALLMFGGMSLYEALSHAFSTMATGGFSTRSASIAAFSPYIQYVISLFMFLAGTNFIVIYFGLHGKMSKVWKNDEFRSYVLILAVAIISVSSLLIYHTHAGLEESFRAGLFQVVSIMTTTGFVSSDYLSWHSHIWFIIFMLMFVGGSAGSTGGGVKVVRILMLFRNSRLEFKRLIHPQAILPVRFNGKVVSQDVVFNIQAFIIIYVLIFIFGAFALTLFGHDFDTAIGASIATLGNIGPGIGKVGPVDNYAALPLASKWLLSFFMLVGRLELFTVLLLFSPSFWRK